MSFVSRKKGSWKHGMRKFKQWLLVKILQTFEIVSGILQNIRFKLFKTVILTPYSFSEYQISSLKIIT